MQRLHFAVGPGKRRNVVGYFEQSAREIVPGRLVVAKCGARPLHNRARQQFRIAQRVGNAVGGERIFKVPGIADERPPVPGAGLDKSDMSAESTNRLPLACRVKPRGESWRSLANQATVCGRGVAVDLRAKASRRHRREHTGGTLIRGNGADTRTRLETPVIAVHW